MTDWVFVDTSAFYALTDKGNLCHEEAAAFARGLAESGTPLLTTSLVRAEAYGLVLLRLGRRKAQAFLAGLRLSATRVVHSSEADEKTAEAILSQYDDQDFSYVDAVSFSVIKRLRIRRVFAFDTHFSLYRPPTGPLLVNR